MKNPKIMLLTALTIFIALTAYALWRKKQYAPYCDNSTKDQGTRGYFTGISR